jgi:hypothetical protein
MQLKITRFEHRFEVLRTERHGCVLRNRKAKRIASCAFWSEVSSI